jgi:hypothetical protein
MSGWFPLFEWWEWLLLAAVATSTFVFVRWDEKRIDAQLQDRDRRP